MIDLIHLHLLQVIHKSGPKSIIPSFRVLYYCPISLLVAQCFHCCFSGCPRDWNRRLKLIKDTEEPISLSSPQQSTDLQYFISPFPNAHPKNSTLFLSGIFNSIKSHKTLLVVLYSWWSFKIYPIFILLFVVFYSSVLSKLLLGPFLILMSTL